MSNANTGDQLPLHTHLIYWTIPL